MAELPWKLFGKSVGFVEGEKGCITERGELSIQLKTKFLPLLRKHPNAKPDKHLRKLEPELP